MTGTPLAVDIKADWLDLGEALGVAGVDWDDILSRLVAEYQSYSRHYHTLEHVAEFIDHYRRLTPKPAAAHGIDDATFRLAIYFHDAIYDVTAKDNEEKSADWLRTQCGAQAVDDAVIAKACRYVMATKHLGGGPRDLLPDEAYFADLDLAILGAPAERYRRYADDIRREYHQFDDASYANGRAGALRHLAGVTPVFATIGRSLSVPSDWEVRARANIAAEIATLSSEAKRG